MGQSKIFFLSIAALLIFSLSGCVPPVPEVIEVTGVDIIEDDQSIKVDEILQLTAVVTPEDADNKAITWESDNPDVATVDDNGMVTALKSGIANITVITEDGSFANSIKITVTKPSPTPTIKKYKVTFQVYDEDIAVGISRNSIDSSGFKIEIFTDAEKTRKKTDTETDSEGKTSVKLPNGEYWFSVTKEGYLDYPPETIVHSVSRAGLTDYFEVDGADLDTPIYVPMARVYTVIIADVVGGTATVIANPDANVLAGETVTVNISDIESGKNFYSITVTGDVSTNLVTTTEVTEGVEYNFSMPSEDVTVAVTLDQSGFEVAVPMDDQNAGIAFNIEISNGTDVNGNLLNGTINVAVSSSVDGGVFNDTASFTAGSATIPLNLTTAGEHYFTVTITGVTGPQTSLGVTVWYAVTFNSNGGSLVDSVTGIANNATITLPDDPTRTGYTFGGWFTDDGTFSVPFTESTPVIASIDVYAKWMPDLPVNWNFEDASKRGDAESSSDISQYTPDEGSGTIGLIGAVFGNFTQGSGGSGTYAAHSRNWNGGADNKYWQITVSTTRYKNLKISSKQRSSDTGPRDFKVQYSTDGFTWVDVPEATITVADNFTSGVLDEVLLPEECENQGTLYLRWIMTSNISVNTGTVGTSGTNRIDDILLTGEVII